MNFIQTHKLEYKFDNSDFAIVKTVKWPIKVPTKPLQQ